jgi:hypothetical protein
MMAQPSYSEGRGTRPSWGCGGKALTFFRGVGTNTLSCPIPKCPKKKQTRKQTNKRRKMQQTQFINSTDKLLKRTIPIIITAGLTLQVLLTGCASIDRKEETVHEILTKENVLLQKVKLERAQPEVSQAVLQSESLKKAEAHLALAIDEIIKANEVVTMKLMKQDEKEVEIERSARSDR